MGKKRRKVFRRQADRSWKELKPRKRGPGRPPKEPLTPYMKRKAERLRAAREAFDENMRKSRREPLDHERKLATAGWTKDLSWQSKPPPPEFIYMIIGGKPIKCRLMTMHNMPVYLPDIDELP
jgi:hypothetical protein